MKTARRPIFILLSLLAMLALQLPVTLWACPMTGALGDAAEVCPTAMPKADAPCSHASGKSGGKCCKPLTVPASSQNDDGKGAPHSFTLTAANAASAAPALLSVSVALFWPQRFAFGAPERTWRALSCHSPPRLAALFRPAALAGRAPPLS